MATPMEEHRQQLAAAKKAEPTNSVRTDYEILKDFRKSELEDRKK